MKQNDITKEDIENLPLLDLIAKTQNSIIGSAKDYDTITMSALKEVIDTCIKLGAKYQSNHFIAVGDVEKAAEMFAGKDFENKSSFEYHNQYTSFKAGAEWQAKQQPINNNSIDNTINWLDESINKRDAKNDLYHSGKADAYNDVKIYLQSLKNK